MNILSQKFKIVNDCNSILQDQQCLFTSIIDNTTCISLAAGTGMTQVCTQLYSLTTPETVIFKALLIYDFLFPLTDNDRMKKYRKCGIIFYNFIRPIKSVVSGMHYSAHAGTIGGGSVSSKIKTYMHAEYLCNELKTPLEVDILAS